MVCHYGITTGSSVICLIAAIATANDFPLCHRDFDHVARVTPLRVALGSWARA